jgi:predicted alpha/beta-hydrolase family hydrolase
MEARGSAEASIAFGDRELPGLWTPAPDPVAVAVIAHGANNDMRHPFFSGAASALAEGGVSALRFNFPYKSAGRSYPDRPPVLLEAWRAALADANERGRSLPVVASGKSLGGRMASMLAAEDGESFAGAAIVFFGYPLHAPGRAGQPRDDHLPSVRVPMLFIQGTADPLASFDLMEALVARLGERARLHTVDGGDHSFRVRRARRPDGDIGSELGGVAAGFIREVVAG